MSESPSKESDIPSLSHIGSSVERHSSVVDSVCDSHTIGPFDTLKDWISYGSIARVFITRD